MVAEKKTQRWLVVSTHWKNMLVNLDHFPKFWMKIKHIWTHHPAGVGSKPLKGELHRGNGANSGHRVICWNQPQNSLLKQLPSDVAD